MVITLKLEHVIKMYMTKYSLLLKEQTEVWYTYLICVVNCFTEKMLETAFRRVNMVFCIIRCVFGPVSDLTYFI